MYELSYFLDLFFSSSLSYSFYQILHLQPTVNRFAKAKPSAETKKEKEHWKRNLEIPFPTNKVSILQSCDPRSPVCRASQ